MINTILTAEERDSLIQWCILFSGYHPSYYEKMDDKTLGVNYEKLVSESEP